MICATLVNTLTHTCIKIASDRLRQLSWNLTNLISNGDPNPDASRKLVSTARLQYV